MVDSTATAETAAFVGLCIPLKSKFMGLLDVCFKILSMMDPVDFSC